MMKVCKTCNVEKPLDAFMKCINSKGGYRATCKSCRNANFKRWAELNREKYLSGMRERRRANWESHKEKSKLRMRILAQNPAWVSKRRERDSSRQHITNARNSAYRGKVRQCTPSWSNKFFVEEAYRLARHRTEVTGVQWSVDHVVPIKSTIVCGLHCEHNLAVITASANRIKSNRFWPDMP